MYISFFTCILWIYTEANEVVGLLTALGFIWKIDSAIMGLTFLAWANSVGDLVSDISLAKAGKARTAVAACFGTPLLNLLGTFYQHSILLTSKIIFLNYQSWCWSWMYHWYSHCRRKRRWSRTLRKRQKLKYSK